MAEIATRGARVLVVDDDPLICWALEREFRAHDLDISHCREGKAALGLVGAAPCDLVVLDVHLPDANGIDLLAEIRRISPRTRGIVISGDASPATVRRAVAAGAEQFIEKPFDPSVIRGYAQAMFRNYPVRRRHPRHACRIPLRISVLAPLPAGAGPDRDKVKGIAENVAPGGVRVATNFPLVAGQVVRLMAGGADAADPLAQFIPPHATAEVRWTSMAAGGFSAGLSFTKPGALRETSREGEA